MNFGFYRNVSDKILFNIVKTLAVTRFVNKSNKKVSIFIPKGTILEGSQPTQAHIETTEPNKINIPPNGEQQVSMNHQPLN